MNNNISDKDKKDWQDFLSKIDPLPNKDSKISEENITKSKSFDLHGYSLDQANKQIEDLIKSSHESGIKKLIIVTGKGIHSKNEKDPYISKELGILRYSVPEYIRNQKELMKLINSIEEADSSDGGSGAFYIFLKKKL